jgi:chemotaxis protein MotB
MADESKIIIIKKVKKGHGGHHGGAWKVAYADFVTAMMAFFLLLWLLSMTSDAQKAVLSQYFQHFSLFDTSGKSFTMETAETGLVPGASESKTVELTENATEATSNEDIEARLTEAVQESLAEVKDHVLVDSFAGGVRIQIVDLEASPMFPSGSAVPEPKAKAIIQVVAATLKNIPNKIAVEGHTDAAPFRSGQITNWELSTGRASAARIELEKDGIDSSRIARVVGYAANDLLVKNKPLDPRNRRVSIIVLEGKTASFDEQPETAPPASTETVGGTLPEATISSPGVVNIMPPIIPSR